MSWNIHRGAYIRGLYPGAYNRGFTTGGLITGGLYRGLYAGLYPGGLYPGDLKSTLTIFKDSTCLTRAELARAFAANK